MKTVFNNSEVCHVFAQRVQKQGRNQQNSLFFYGDKLYSYGYHYLLSEFMDNKKGDTVVYLNDFGYSNTTAKHLNYAVSALNHYSRYYETSKPSNVSKELDYLYKKLLKARKPAIYVEQAKIAFNSAERWFNDINLSKDEIKAYKDCIKKIKLFVVDSDELKEQQIKAKKIADKRKRDVKRLSKQYADAWIKKDDETIEKVWQKAKSKGIEFRELKNNEHYLRINGDKVETTSGATVDIKEAATLYKLIESGKDIKGYRIGYYTVISLNGTLKIGCHNINVENMHTIGKQLLTL